MNEEDILKFIANDPWRIKVLGVVFSLKLPDWLIAAGFVRNPIWDYLHGYSPQAHATDIDVVYFDPSDLREETEKEYQQLLGEQLSADWSVTNQARMAKINNQDVGYTSTEDAIAHWPETATAIGVRLLEDGNLKLVAPYGIDDLVNLKIRMAPQFGDGLEVFKSRSEKKQWLTKWPKLKTDQA